MKGCCKWLDREEWDRKTHVWRGKPFYVEDYRSFFYMPLDLGKGVSRMARRLEKRGLLPEQPVILCRNEGMWGGVLCIEMTEPDPELPVEKLSGRFFSMYFEAEGYKEAGKLHKTIQDYCRDRGWEPKEYLSYYATCPECAEKYGKMQIILLARLD